MARWRDTKKGKFTKKNIENEQPQEVVPKSILFSTF